MGNSKYELAARYASLFRWERPPLPASCADHLAELVNEKQVKSVLVLGSCCPSVLVAVGFGDKTRVVRAVSVSETWGQSYGDFVEDSSSPDDYPRFDRWLPNSVKISSDLPYRVNFDLVFIDQDYPFEDAPPEKFAQWLQGWCPRFVVLGHCEGFSPPISIQNELCSRGAEFEKLRGTKRNLETGQSLEYTLAIWSVF